MVNIDKMASFFLMVRTYVALGVINIARVAIYRIGLRLGVHPVLRGRAELVEGDFFAQQAMVRRDLQPPTLWTRHMQCFGYSLDAVLPEIPDWHRNPLTGVRHSMADKPWHTISDFDSQVGDIKGIWELSRFDWVLALTQQACAGNADAAHRLNAWLNDWVVKNPPYCGPNWKCGQEASIRVMHLAMASVIAGTYKHPSRPLLVLIKAHLLRIAPTISYAIAQDNNHGTSEAAALFIGGSWLRLAGDADGVRWEDTGRKWLEERAGRLIAPDGSFSQHSATYHRVALDTYSMVEVWRRHTGQAALSAVAQSRLAAAANWLFQMTQPDSGDAPNLGSNDGAHLLRITDADYRDFRPSIQLGIALFCNAKAYVDERSDLALQWLGIPVPEQRYGAASSAEFRDGGYAVLRSAGRFALLRYPRFRFRPCQSDVLHVDLWSDGVNVLRDAGTYSYNAGDNWLNYFGGTASHNTVQFDDRDQMPRLGRFLFGAWLRASRVDALVDSGGAAGFGAAYRDRNGASHHRSLRLCGAKLQVDDCVAGFRKRALLRWRLAPGTWTVDGNAVTNGKHRLSVRGDMAIRRFGLTEGWESRYYLRKTPTPVLEVEITEPGTLITEYQWQE